MPDTLGLWWGLDHTLCCIFQSSASTL